MMSRKFLPIAGGLLLVVGVLAFGTWRCMGWMVDCRMRTAQGTRWSSETWPRLLNLSEEQRSKIQPMEKALAGDMSRLQNELTQKQIALCRSMMSPAQPDAKAMARTVEEISTLKMRKEQKMLDHLLALRRVLTSDQQKVLFTTMMQDICRGCRRTTGAKQDYCGFCKKR